MNKIIDKTTEKAIQEFLEKQTTQDAISKIENTSDYHFKVVVTTDGIDRDGEVLDGSGIDFQAYMKNPVVLINHEYKVESIVAKTLKIYQEGGKTIAEGVFAKGVEKAELVRSLYNQGFIKTVSIGFIAKERSEQNRDVISKSEMLEFSFVAVPANPEALSLDGKVYKKCLEAGLVKEAKDDDYSGCVMLDVSNGMLSFVSIEYLDLYYGPGAYNGGGIEYYKHITLLYGIGKDVTRDEVFGKIEYNKDTVNILGLKVFENENYDVLVAEVELSDFLKKTNESLKNLDHKNDFPDYKPHITIAYLKKGRGVNYTSIKTTINELPTTGVVYSPSGERGYYKKEVSEKSFDLSTFNDNIKTLQDGVLAIQESLKTFSEDNEKKKNREKVQDIVKLMSKHLEVTKTK